ncbi:MAG: carboxypeptidase regulatory-like domain-containing protein [Deltaproteobacteria bacterium]|nr:carboxypeptidase regulatory-like domain-containing protein [Deltaproteobacteria bacterium]
MKRLAGLAVVLAACGPGARTHDAALPERCEDRGLPPTTISGIVLAPNHTLPLYGATVYIPASEPGPFTDGVACSRCTDPPPGDALARATSDELGRFTLANAPAGRDVPIVIQLGKWRRRATLPEVVPCRANEAPVELTALPRSRAEGDLPRIAIATGGCDALECLLRKLGVADEEFTPDYEDGRVHLYASTGADHLEGRPLAAARTLWADPDRLRRYDIAMFSCECRPFGDDKTPEMVANVRAFADAGGRVFLSHYHNVWLGRAWPGVASCPSDEVTFANGVIDAQGHPKSAAFAGWMTAIGAAPNNSFPIEEGRQTCTGLDPARAERWIRLDGTPFPQTFQFTTPNDAAPEARCGRVVFSDVHVATGSRSAPETPFPLGCASVALAPQEQALAFLFFDIASCVGPVL